MHKEIEPKEVQRDAIKCFWYTRIDMGEEQPGFEVLPDGYAEIIFHFSDTCKIAYNGIIQPLPSPFIMGLLDKPVQIYTQNRFEIIAVRCYPWTVFDMLGLPAGSKGAHVFEHPIAKLQIPLFELIKAGSIDEALNFIKENLPARPAANADATIFKAGAALRGNNGSLQVSDVATAANATVRTLERKFMRSSGRSVKDVSGLIRFEQVRNRLWTDPYASLSSLAYELGYTDQAHLSRAFKRYSGITPAAFARENKKRRQAAGDDFVAFIQA